MTEYPTLNPFRALYEGYTLESTDGDIRLKLRDTKPTEKKLYIQLKDIRPWAFTGTPYEWMILALKDWNKLEEERWNPVAKEWRTY